MTNQPTSESELSQLYHMVQQMGQTLAAIVEPKVVQGMGVAPRQPRIHGMQNSVDQLTKAYEALMGLPVRGSYHKLSGIRELYITLTGDREMRGLYNPDLAMLAYNPSGNNADTTSMADITRNVMNKALVYQAGLLEEYNWWRKVARIENFNSLQQVSWVQVAGIGELPTVSEKAEYTQLGWEDDRTTASWVKKGGYLPLSLETIDRDDVQAWRSVPQQLATAAVVTLSATVSALFTDNSHAGPALGDGVGDGYAFNTTRGNLLTQPLDYTNWNLAVETMYKLSQLLPSSASDYGTRRIAVRPKFVLVPVDLEAQAISVVTSDRRPGGDTNDRVPLKRLLPEENVITVPHWTDSDNWAALADPAVSPFVGVGFRFGEQPELFTAADPNSNLLFTNDVLPIKVRWFFAVSVIDWRGAVKSNN